MTIDWTTAKLGELVSFKTGKLDSNAARPKGAYPFFTCSQQTLRTDTYSFDAECVLLAGNNANGIYPLKYYNGKFDVYQRTYVIRSLNSGRLLNRFLYYSLRPKLGLLQSISTGVATKFLTMTLLNDLEIDLPEIETQERIVGVLSAYDDLIENNVRRIQILEETTQTLYRDWFVHFCFPDHEEIELVDSRLGKIPKGWEVVKFTDLSDVLSGGTPKTTVAEYWGGSIPFFSPADAPLSSYVISTEKQVTELGLSKCNSRLYPKDTVFITARGTVGSTVMSAGDMAMNQSCYALLGREGITQLYLFLLTLHSVDYLKKNTGGATFQTIVIDTFRQFDVAKPPSPIIDRFTEKVRPLFDSILNLLRRNSNLRRARDLLLPKLVSGEIKLDKELCE